jgi:cellulose synthase/poly-beta-1,6-N-acetylglucosamine synthase-like glycosyltransferase
MQARGSKKHRLSTLVPAAARGLASHDSHGREGLVSVMIRAYNEAATVERTIYSVRNQTYSYLQVQVVDDVRPTRLESPGRKVTMVADLTSADQFRSNTFDCIILTQTLQYIYKLPGA